MVRALESARPPSEAGVTAAFTPMPSVVAVCYNSMINTDAEVVAAALRSCPAGRLTAREDDQLWTRCPLLQPERANFICAPDGPPALSTPAQ